MRAAPLAGLASCGHPYGALVPKSLAWREIRASFDFESCRRSHTRVSRLRAEERRQNAQDCSLAKVPCYHRKLANYIVPKSRGRTTCQLCVCVCDGGENKRRPNRSRAEVRLPKRACPPNGLSLSCTAGAHVPKPTRRGGCRRGVTCNDWAPRPA